MLFGVSIWIYVMVLFLIVEAASAALLSIWFCFGAFAAWIVSLFTESMAIQGGVFLLVSLVLLIFTREIAKKLIKSKKEQKTNLDLIVGERALVIEEIDNTREKGSVKIKGNIWTARGLDDKIFKKDELVTVVRIEGVKLIVTENKEG